MNDFWKTSQEGDEEEDDPYDDAEGDYDMDNADEMNAEADMAGELPSPNDDWNIQFDNLLAEVKLWWIQRLDTIVGEQIKPFWQILKDWFIKNNEASLYAKCTVTEKPLNLWDCN